MTKATAAGEKTTYIASVLEILRGHDRSCFVSALALVLAGAKEWVLLLVGFE